MNKFGDHWRKKMNDPEEQKDFLKEEVKADMWEKIQSSKNSFEQAWKKKTNNIEAWEGALEEAARQALWDKLQISLAQFELQWREKMAGTDKVTGVFLDDEAKERIAASVFEEEENFCSEWQDKMNDPALALREGVLETGSKEIIWNNIRSAIIKPEPAPKEKRRSLFALRWSHAAALLIGAFSTWLIWNQTANAPLQNTLAGAPKSEIASAENPAGPSPEQIQTSKQRAPGAEQQEEVIAKYDALMAVKDKAPVVVRKDRELTEAVAGNISSVKPVQPAVVLVKPAPVINTDNTTEDKANTTAPEKETEATVAKVTPARKVVHISDLRPAEVQAKGTAIYARAFGESREKRNEKSTMTFNTVLKNYK